MHHQNKSLIDERQRDLPSGEAYIMEGKIHNNNVELD
jgi:hypothetical protein